MFGKFRQSLALAVLTATGSLFAAAHVDNTWSGNGGDADLANASNWTKTWTTDNEIHQMMRNFPTGTYTMSRDMTICAFRFDDKNRDINFNLGSERTLTITGVDMQPFRFREGAAGTSFRLAGGTIRHVYDTDAYTYSKDESSQYMLLPEKDICHDETFIVDGPNSRLETRGLTMRYGTNVWLVVTNGAQVVGNVSLTHRLRSGRGCGVRVAGSTSVFEPTGEALDENGIFTLSTGGTAENFTLEFLDGAKPWSGCTGINVGTNGCGGCLAYRGAATAVSHTGANLLIGSAKGSFANRVEVTDGASLDLGNQRFWLGSHVQSVSNVLYVAGEGSSVTSTATSSHYIGQRSGGNLVHLDDHAAMALAGSVCVGNASGNASGSFDNSGNRLLIENGATLSCKDVKVGLGQESNPSRNDSALVRGGGRLAVTGAVTIAGDDGSVADGSFMRAEGALSQITASSYLRIGRYSGTCGFELFDGAHAAFESYGYLGDNASVSPGTNHLTIVDSELTLGGRFATFGADDVIAVTNGRICAKDMYLSYSNAAATNLHVFVAGTNPVLQASEGDIVIRNGANVHFTVPKGGYAEPVFQCVGKLDIRNAMMTFELEPGCEIPQQGMVLAEAGEIGCYESTKRKVKAALPEGVRLKFATVGDKQRFVLCPRVGMCLILR